MRRKTPASMQHRRAGRHILVRHALEAVRTDRGDHRKDAPNGIGSTGRAVLVGGLEEGLDDDVHRCRRIQVGCVSELDDRRGVEAPRTGGGVVPLLEAPAGDVELEEATAPHALVPACEQRDHHEALHCSSEVAAHHLAELVGLALQAQRGTLDLLVVLELELEQPDHLHRRAGGSGDGDPGMAVGREHLLNGTMADEVARGRPPVSRHHHAVGRADGDDRGAVGDGAGLEGSGDVRGAHAHAFQ